MTQYENHESGVVENGPVDRPEKVPLTARLLLHESLTARRAAVIIAAFTVLITVAGGILVLVLDQREYHSIGRGIWFALQTVTTVGYGDVTPEQPNGRIIAGVIMLTGIGFIAVITASVTSSLVENSRRRFAGQAEADLSRWLEEVIERLARIEAQGSHPAPPRSPDGLS